MNSLFDLINQAPTKQEEALARIHEDLKKERSAVTDLQAFLENLCVIEEALSKGCTRLTKLPLSETGSLGHFCSSLVTSQSSCASHSGRMAHTVKKEVCSMLAHLSNSLKDQARKLRNDGYQHLKDYRKACEAFDKTKSGHRKLMSQLIRATADIEVLRQKSTPSASQASSHSNTPRNTMNARRAESSRSVHNGHSAASSKDTASTSSANTPQELSSKALGSHRKSSSTPPVQAPSSASKAFFLGVGSVIASTVSNISGGDRGESGSSTPNRHHSLSSAAGGTSSSSASSATPNASTASPLMGSSPSESISSFFGLGRSDKPEKELAKLQLKVASLNAERRDSCKRVLRQGNARNDATRRFHASMEATIERCRDLSAKRIETLKMSLERLVQIVSSQSTALTKTFQTLEAELASVSVDHDMADILTKRNLPTKSSSILTPQKVHESLLSEARMSRRFTRELVEFLKAIQVMKTAYSDSLVKLSRTRFVLRPSADPQLSSASLSSHSNGRGSVGAGADLRSQSGSTDLDDPEVNFDAEIGSQSVSKAVDSGPELLEQAVNAMLIYVESIGKQFEGLCAFLSADVAELSTSDESVYAQKKLRFTELSRLARAQTADANERNALNGKLQRCTTEIIQVSQNLQRAKADRDALSEKLDALESAISSVITDSTPSGVPSGEQSSSVSIAADGATVNVSTGSPSVAASAATVTEQGTAGNGQVDGEDEEETEQRLEELAEVIETLALRLSEAEKQRVVLEEEMRSTNERYTERRKADQVSLKAVCDHFARLEREKREQVYTVFSRIMTVRLSIASETRSLLDNLSTRVQALRPSASDELFVSSAAFLMSSAQAKDPQQELGRVEMIAQRAESGGSGLPPPSTDSAAGGSSREPTEKASSGRESYLVSPPASEHRSRSTSHLKRQEATSIVQTPSRSHTPRQEAHTTPRDRGISLTARQHAPLSPEGGKVTHPGLGGLVTLRNSERSFESSRKDNEGSANLASAESRSVTVESSSVAIESRTVVVESRSVTVESTSVAKGNPEQENINPALNHVDSSSPKGMAASSASKKSVESFAAESAKDDHLPNGDDGRDIDDFEDVIDSGDDDDNVGLSAPLKSVTPTILSRVTRARSRSNPNAPEPRSHSQPPEDTGSKKKKKKKSVAKSPVLLQSLSRGSGAAPAAVNLGTVANLDLSRPTPKSAKTATPTRSLPKTMPRIHRQNRFSDGSFFEPRQLLSRKQKSGNKRDPSSTRSEPGSLDSLESAGLSLSRSPLNGGGQRASSCAPQEDGAGGVLKSASPVLALSGRGQQQSDISRDLRKLSMTPNGASASPLPTLHEDQSAAAADDGSLPPPFSLDGYPRTRGTPSAAAPAPSTSLTSTPMSALVSPRPRKTSTSSLLADADAEADAEENDVDVDESSERDHQKQPPLDRDRSPQVTVTSTSSLASTSIPVSPQVSVTSTPMPPHAPMASTLALASGPRSRSTSPLEEAQSAFEKKLHEYRVRFDLPQEVLIEDYSCAVFDKFPWHGRMFISSNYLCFYSNVGAETIKIPLLKILDVQKRTTALLFKNSIEIVCEGHTFFFSSFLYRERAFNDILKVWKVRSGMRELDVVPVPQAQQIQRPPSREDYGAGGSIENGDTKETIDSDEKAGDGASVPSSSSPKSSGSQPPVLEPYDYPPVSVESRPKRVKGFEEVKPGILDVCPERLFELFYSDKGSAENARYLRESGDSDVVFSDWEKCDDHTFTREIHSRHPLDGFGSVVGVSETQITVKQRLYRVSRDHFVITQKVLASGFSVAETFEMDGDIDVRSTSPGADKCKLQMAFRVRFIKFTLLKRVLDVAMRRENHAVYLKLIDFIGDVVQKFQRTYSTGAAKSESESTAAPSEPITVGGEVQRSIEEKKQCSSPSPSGSGSRPSTSSSSAGRRGGVKSADEVEVSQSTMAHRIFNRRVGSIVGYATGAILTVFLLLWVITALFQWSSGLSLSHGGGGGALPSDTLAMSRIDAAELRDELRGISSELKELNALVRDMVDILRAKAADGS